MLTLVIKVFARSYAEVIPITDMNVKANIMSQTKNISSSLVISGASLSILRL